jgi:hypothetical protein
VVFLAPEKTTLARQPEGVMPALRLSADDWMNELSINPHAEKPRAKLEGLQWQLATRLLQLGVTVIVGEQPCPFPQRIPSYGRLFGAHAGFLLEVRCVRNSFSSKSSRIGRHRAERTSRIVVYLLAILVVVAFIWINPPIYPLNTVASSTKQIRLLNGSSA